MELIRKLVKEELENIYADECELTNNCSSECDEERLQNLEECMHLLRLALNAPAPDDLKLEKVHTILYSFDKFG